MPAKPVAGHTWALGAVAALVDTARAAARSVVRLDVQSSTADEPFLVLRDDGPGLTTLGVRSRLGATAPSVSARLRSGSAAASAIPAQLPTPEKGFAGTPWLGAVFRLGRDVCLLSKMRESGPGDAATSGDGNARVIALLSRTGAVDGSLTSIVVVDWDRNPEEKAKAMPSLTTYSPWSTEQAITEAFDSLGETGLLVAVFNLRRTVEEAVLELDVESDETDILLDPPEEEQAAPGVPEYAPLQPLTVHTSMRAYLQVLYLESSATDLVPGTSRGPRIYLRDVIVREMRVCASLLHPLDYSYTPRQEPEGATLFRLGINACYRDIPPGSPASALQRRDVGNPDAHATLASDQDWGMLVYCHGRLVWPYVRFSAHEVVIPTPSSGVGSTIPKRKDVMPVVGVVQADAWIANPNAQGFAPTDLLKRSKAAIERNMANYIARYWSSTAAESVSQDTFSPPETWARCDECHAWRIVARPPTTNMSDVHIVPKWVCEMNAGGTTRCNGRDDPFVRVPSGKGKAKLSSWPVGGYTTVAPPKRGRPRGSGQVAVKRIRVGDEWHESAPTSSVPSDTLSEQQAAAFAQAEQGVTAAAEDCVDIEYHHMALPAVVGSLPPHGTVGDDGEFVPELDLNARTPEPHELPIPDDIASPDNFVLSSAEVAEQQRELDRLRVDNVDEARDSNAAGSVGAFEAALAVPMGLYVAAQNANEPASTKSPAEIWTGQSAPASAHNEAAVALVAMNRSADCVLDAVVPGDEPDRAGGSPHLQAESDEVRDAIASVDRHDATPQRMDIEANGHVAFANGSGDPGDQTEAFAQYPGDHARGGNHFPHVSPAQAYENPVVAVSPGRFGNGPSEHQSEGSKGPSHRPSPVGVRRASTEGRESGHGSLSLANGGANDGGRRRDERRSGDGGDCAGGSGMGSGSGMGGTGERGVGDGPWRAKFLELAALLDEDRQPRGTVLPLQSLGIDEADALVKEIKQHVAGISDEAISARAEQTLACEQLDGVRRLIRVFLERGVGIVRPEDDEDEPIESHFSAYLRMIDVLQGSTELA